MKSVRPLRNRNRKIALFQEKERKGGLARRNGFFAVLRTSPGKKLKPVTTALYTLLCFFDASHAELLSGSIRAFST
jgi:hypothetical protein